MVDSWVEWAEDSKPFASRPFGDRQEWIGYDPAETGDCSGLVVCAPPLVPGGKYRVMERHQFRGMDFAAQAAFIKSVCDRNWVTYIGIDVTGLAAAWRSWCASSSPTSPPLAIRLKSKPAWYSRPMT